MVKCYATPIAQIFFGTLGEASVLITFTHKDFKGVGFWYLRVIAICALLRNAFEIFFTVCWCTTAPAILSTMMCIYTRSFVERSPINIFTMSTIVTLGLCVDRHVALWLPLKYKQFGKWYFVAFFTLLGLIVNGTYDFLAMIGHYVDSDGYIQKYEWWNQIWSQVYDAYLAVLPWQGIITAILTGTLIIGMFKGKLFCKRIIADSRSEKDKKRDRMLTIMLLCQAFPLLALQIVNRLERDVHLSWTWNLETAVVIFPMSAP